MPPYIRIKKRRTNFILPVNQNFSMFHRNLFEQQPQTKSIFTHKHVLTNLHYRIRIATNTGRSESQHHLRVYQLS